MYDTGWYKDNQFVRVYRRSIGVGADEYEVFCENGVTFISHTDAYGQKRRVVLPDAVAEALGIVARVEDDDIAEAEGGTVE